MGHVRINDDEGPTGSANPLDIVGNVTSPAPTTFPSMGVKVVTTAGTRVPLAATSTPLVKNWIQVIAWPTNTGVIYVGDVTVTSSNGVRLGAGMTLILEWTNLADVYIDASVSSEGVSYTGW